MHAQQASEIGDLALADADVIDRERALTGRVLDSIGTHGFFRLLVPRNFGGAELPLPAYVPLIERIAEGDASTAWCVNQAAVYATMASRTEPETAREVWGDPHAAVANGPPAPATITPVQGGHRLSGRWEFSSGCRHANWFAAATIVDHVMQVSLIPRADVSLVDVWHVQGLRGTGSFSFEVSDAFVPSRRVFDFNSTPRVSGPLYAVPVNLLFAAGFAAVALGNARSALDAARELLSDKQPVFERADVRERASVQLDVGRAEATWGAARAYLAERIEALWATVTAEGQPSRTSRIGLRLASTHAIQCAADAVQTVYRTCGSTAIFDASPMQRRFQDAHVITQQVQGRLSHYETVGQELLGMAPKAHFF